MKRLNADKMAKHFILLLLAIWLCSCAHRNSLSDNRYIIDGLDTSEPSTYAPPCGGDAYIIPLDPNEPRHSVYLLLYPLAFEITSERLLENLSVETSDLLLQQLSERKTTLDDFYKQYGGWCDCAMSFQDSSKILKEIDPWTTANSKGMVQLAICDEEEEADIFNLIVEREGGRCYIKSDDPYGLLVSLSARVRECFKCYNPCTNEEYEPKTEPVVPPGMVLIPAGTFMMGCTVGDTQCDRSENPSHLVAVKAFYMDKTEVTVAAYRKCVEAGMCSPPATEGECNWGLSGRDGHPVNCIGWQQAKTFCKWAGGRLPSEAEWEYAARGGHSDWIYPWGNQEADCNRAVMAEESKKGCGWNSTWQVGGMGAYGFGLKDMAGNVWEWIEDCWHMDYTDAPTDGRAWVSGDCELRILHGGSYDFHSMGMRVSCRFPGIPDDKESAFGLRCAKSVE